MRLSSIFLSQERLTTGAVEAKAWLSKTVTDSEKAYRGWEPELPQEAEPPRTPICLLICTGEAAAVGWTWQTCVPYGLPT